MNKLNRRKILLSIVFPIYNEEKSLPHLVKTLKAVKKLLPSATEVIFVNDGSTDQSSQILRAIRIPYNKKVIVFSRNFGHQAALLAGLEKSSGEYVVTLDADLQHPIGLIPQMIKYHQKGIDIVLTQRVSGKETTYIKKQSSALFYNVLNSLSTQKFSHSSSDFRSLNRRALNSLLAMPEKRKFLRGMVQWIGFTVVVLPFTVKPRIEGESKYTSAKMIKLALEGITSFSTLPLYLSALFGGVLFVCALLYATYVVYIKFFQGSAIQGWASVLFVQLVIGGFLSIFLGVIGIYIAAVYDEVKNRPNFIIKEVYEN